MDIGLMGMNEAHIRVERRYQADGFAAEGILNNFGARIGQGVGPQQRSRWQEGDAHRPPEQAQSEAIVGPFGERDAPGLNGLRQHALAHGGESHVDAVDTAPTE
jgi:hypothetical protein